LITKAILPVAGLGTRFLPASKAIPKEMLPIIDKPLVQYAVEEAIEIGIKEIIFITSPEKYSIEKHFKKNDDLELSLKKSGKSNFIQKLNPKVFSEIKFHYVNQKEQNGLGHAILQAEKLIGNESFAILLPDDLFISHKSCLSQLLDIHTNKKSSVIAVNRIDKDNIHRYGVIKLLRLMI
jgi:UTP--glucose-1-phosphate uridylyltransferase